MSAYNKKANETALAAVAIINAKSVCIHLPAK